MLDLVGRPMPVSLVYAARRNLPRRVQVFMDWLAGVLAPSLDPSDLPSNVPVSC